MSWLQITATGPLTTVQDRGRPGWASVGVGQSGAADITSHDAANRLVGNVIGSATLEVTLGGLAFRPHGDVYLAVTGAPAGLSVDGTPVGHGSALAVPSGAEVVLDYAASGLRTYVAVRGGISVRPVLGSRSTDSLSGIGPSRVQAGDALPIGRDVGEWPSVDVNPFQLRIDSILRVVLGPRAEWFTDPERLFSQEWTVASQSDRVGMKLEGRPLERRAGELPSEGMVTGALQVPPSGLPVLFLVDHPVTGGYPVVGVVVADDIPVAAQYVPGRKLRFVRA
ncbi:biotin-dependent carboxyltransferase family protein [Actinomycetes bacterium M1A6_2h]